MYLLADAFHRAGPYRDKCHHQLTQLAGFTVAGAVVPLCDSRSPDKACLCRSFKRSALNKQLLSPISPHRSSGKNI